MIAPDVKTHVAISQAGEKFENKMFFHGFASALQERNALQCKVNSIECKRCENYFRKMIRYYKMSIWQNNDF